MTSIDDVIQPGQPIPADVTEISDCDDDTWTLRGERWTCEAMLESSLAPRFKGWSPDQLVTKHGPLTVTAVREQPAEPEPQQADASLLLDLVRQYGEESYQQGIAAGQRDEGSEDHYDAKARALHARIAALVPQQPVQARDVHGALLWISETGTTVHRGLERPLGAWRPLLVGGEPRPEPVQAYGPNAWPWWIHDCGRVLGTETVIRPSLYAGCGCNRPGPWLPLLVGGDPAPEPTPTVDLGEALDEAVGDYEAARAKLLEVVVERDLARAELKYHLDAVDRLAEERNEAVAERDSIKAEFDELASLVTVSVVDPLVLSLPEVPEGTVALVGNRTGKRYTRFAGWWEWGNGDKHTYVDLLEMESPDGVTVELASPREPRTWPKLDEEHADLPGTVTVERHGTWRRLAFPDDRLYQQADGGFGAIKVGLHLPLSGLQLLGEVTEVTE